MHHFKYLIVGGGMSADGGVQGIRQIDKEGSIGLVSAETDAPYARPPLSKKLWQDGNPDTIDCGTAARDVELILGRRIVSLIPAENRVVDDRGEIYEYERLLLATGGAPSPLPAGESDKIVPYRTLADYRHVRKLATEHENFAVIGGGFIGSEMTAALALQGKRVQMIFPEQGICARMFPPDLSEFLNNYYRERGVEVLAGNKIVDLQSSQDPLVLSTENGRTLNTDAAVAGLGLRLNLELAEQAGLPVNNGIMVNELLQPEHPNIFAAGDVANYPCAILGKRRRVEHEDNAVTMGTVAGRNMAGAQESYRHLPLFYSDLFDLGYEAVGEIRSDLETLPIWKEQFKKGIVLYLENNRPQGVLLWNVWDQVDAARELIQNPPSTPAALQSWCRERL